MDQTVTYATETYLRDELAKATLRIGKLEEHISTVTQRSYGESAERSRITNEMQEWTLEAMEHGTIDEDTAQQIADICGFELTKEFELEVTVQYSITANAKSEEEAINLMYDIDFDSVSHPEEITYLSSSVDRVEV